MGWNGLGIGIPFRTGGGGAAWSSYWATRYISALSAQATSATEYTITATITGAGQDGMSVEYSDDMGATWNVAGTEATAVYLATGMTSGTLYQWRARLYKGTNYGDYVNSINYLLAGIDGVSCTMPTSGYVYIWNTADLNFYNGSPDSPFYMSFWAKIGTDGYYSLVKKDKEYDLFVIGGRIDFEIYSETNTAVRIHRKTAGTQQAAIQGAWHHILATYDGSGASTGMKIYVDKVQVDVASDSAGSYVGMTYYSANVFMSMGTSGEMVDFKIGSGTLTAQQITDLYDNKVLGTEIVHYPCSEGYGTVLHNVTDQNLEKAAYIYGTGSAWSNTQDFFKYNYNYGGTKVDDYFFPNLSSKVNPFTPIDCIVLAGQSNAEGAGVNAQLAGTDYEDLTDVSLRLAHAYQQGGGFYKKMDFSSYFTTIGVDDLLGYLYTQENKDVFFVKNGPGSAGLYQGSSTDDWHPDTVGDLFDLLAGYITTRLNVIFLLGREPWIKSFIWIQGEKDATLNTWAAAYYDNLVAFFTKWATLLPGTFNIQLGRLSTLFLDNVDSDAVRAAQDLYAANNSNVDLIDTEDATFNDGTHYTSEYLIDMAERMKTNIDGESFANSKSYINKLIPGYNKLYYTAHP